MDLYTVYRAVFIGGLVLAIVFFAVTILLFFVLKIKDAFGDITGKSKRKAIESIKNKSASTEDKAKARINARDYHNKSTSQRLAIESAQTSKIRPQDLFDNLAPETTQLDQSSTETSVLSPSDVVEDEVAAPAVSQTQPIVLEEYNGSDPDFSVEVDITYVHASECVR